MRVAVVGAGGIGGFVAAALARANVPVAVVARGEHLAAIRDGGIRVRGDLGTFTARVDAASDLRQMGDFDALLLTFKAHQWPDLLPQVESFGARGATIVTLQNGLPFWFHREPPLESVDPGGRIGRAFPDEVIVGGVVHVSGHVESPGTIVQSGGMRYVLGPPGGGTSARSDAIIETFRKAGLSPEADSNIRATVWLKLVNNVGFNSISALRRMTIKPMLSNPESRAEARELMNEALQVGKTIGVVSDVDLDARMEYAARLNDVKTSMLQDYERGRSLEVEPILGAVIEMAARHGVDVPKIRGAREALIALSAARAHG